MRLLKLTAIAHPDINHGQPYPVYVNPEHIILIERAKTRQEIWGWQDQHTEAVARFWDEVQRCDGELRASTPQDFMPDTEEHANRINEALRKWTSRKDIAASISAAYGMLNSMNQQPRYHTPVEATCIQLSVPNARYTMLPAVFVTETPEQVVALIEEATSSTAEIGPAPRKQIDLTRLESHL